MIANTLDIAAPEIPAAPSRLTGAVLLPYVALAATVLAWQLGGPAKLAALSRARHAPAPITVDYPTAEHRS